MTANALSPLIDSISLQSLLEAKAPIKIIDARFDLGNAQYGNVQYQKGHIPTALRLDLERDICAPKTGYNGRHPLKTEDALIEALQNIGINNDDHVIIYDDKSGMFASHIWWVFRHLGHENVQLLNGGYAAWQAINGEIEQDIPQVPARGDISLHESDFELVYLPEILDFVLGNHNETLQIIDARGEARFAGKMEPLDPIAGHIPSAINYPFERNLTETGLFKDQATLHSEWTQFLNNREPSTLVHQCGSGISSCHNLFSLYYAGFGPTKLYHGSWSEWCADSERPMVTING